MAFTYLNNIPQAADFPSNSQSQILTNFASIQSLVDVDHVDFANGAAGQHNKVTLFNQAGGLPVFSPLGVVGMYSAGNAVGFSATNQNELWLNTTSAGATVVQIPTTASSLGIVRPAYSASGLNGWTLLPSGIKMAWGTATATGTIAAQTVTLVAPYQMPTTIMSIQVSAFDNTVTTANPYSCWVGTQNAANQFTVFVSKYSGGNFIPAPNTVQFNWLAIGY